MTVMIPFVRVWVASLNDIIVLVRLMMASLNDDYYCFCACLGVFSK